MGKILYWAFEGNEGTGKTTLSKKFAERCGAYWTYEPNGETDNLKFLRQLALNEDSKVPTYARETALLTNRIIHQYQHVAPLISNLSTIVSDRSFLSGMVYANLKSFSFDKFFEISRSLNIEIFPDVIIYCRNKERKIIKNKDDIYDNASEETLQKIDEIYEQALDFIRCHILTKNIHIIEFENDFKKSADKNLDLLIQQTKAVCSKTSWDKD